MSDIVAWECGSCKKTNEDMARRHCLICGEQRPVRYYIVGGPIESEIRRWWYGRSAEPIDGNDDNVNKKSLKRVKIRQNERISRVMQWKRETLNVTVSIFIDNKGDIHKLKQKM